MTPHVTRREFIGAATMATAAATRMSLAQQVAGANEKVRVGVIGCGGICTADLGCFLSNDEVEVPIICDIDDSHFKEKIDLVNAKRGTTPETVKDFRRVIDSDVDALLVCTPDHWHALPTVYGCQAGKDVYVEKPLAKTIEEGRAMVEAAKKHNRIVQMGTQRSSDATMAEAAAFVQSGQLGKIRLVRAWAYLDWVGGIGNPPDGEPPAGVDYDMWLGPAPKRPFNPNHFHFNFRWHWDYAGGLMTDWGVHLLGVCLMAMGPEYPLKVSSFGGKRVIDDNTDTPDTQVAVYDFPAYTLIWEHQVGGGIGPNGRPHGMLFCGENGTLLIDDTGWEIIPEPKKEVLKALEPKTDPDPNGHVFPALGGIKHLPGRDSRAVHVRNFLDCVKSRQQPNANPEIGHHISTVAHLGNIAFRSNSEVHWDSEKEAVTGNRKADALVGVEYRKGWELDYARRG